MSEISVKTRINVFDFFTGFVETQGDPLYRALVEMHDACVLDRVSLLPSEKEKIISEAKLLISAFRDHRQKLLDEKLPKLPKLGQMVRVIPKCINAQNFINYNGDILRVQKVGKNTDWFLVGNPGCSNLDDESERAKFTFGQWFTLDEADFEVQE